MNRSNSAVPGAESAARMLQLSESVSAVNGTECAITAGCTRSRAAVCGRPGEGNDVLTGQVIEQIAEAAAHELQRALGQESPFR